MFERFTDEARDVVVRAQQEARGLGHDWIGAEHLLLGVLAHPHSPGATALARLGVTSETCRAAVREFIGPGEHFSAREADALRTLGIDLDEVRRRVEASFGVGALDARPSRRRRRRLPWRRVHGCRPVAGHIPFTPRAKRALERSLREALALKDRHIAGEHLLLGILDPKGNAAVDLLEQLGAAPDVVRAQVLAELGKAA